MTEERQVCVKQILAKIISMIYKSIGYIVILAIILFFLYPHYQEYEYLKECEQKGRSQEWCEQTWHELRMME